MIDKLKLFFFNSLEKTESFEDAIFLSDFLNGVVNSSFLKIYDFEEFEIKIFDKFLKNEEFEFSSTVNSDDFLYVVTESYRKGGHTPLMERLASMHPQKPSLLVTKNAAYDHSKFFSNVWVIENNSHLIKLNLILKKLSAFEKIILNIHPDDILTILAIRILRSINRKINVYFVNHADHQFCYGRGVSDLVFEVSIFGLYMKEEIGEKKYKSSFLGIPLNFDFSAINATNYLPIGNEIITAGAAWKFKPVGEFSLQRKIKEILKQDRNIKFYVLGANFLLNYWWWPLKLRFPKNVFIMRSMEYNKYIDFLKTKKVFLDSFPMTGGTAFAEAFANGRLPIGFSSFVSGYTPLDNIRISKVSDFFEIRNNSDLYAAKLNGIKSQLIEVHSFTNVKHRFLSALNGFEIQSKSDLDFVQMSLEKGWEFNGLNFVFKNKLLLKKWFYYFVLKFFLHVKISNYLSILKTINFK